MIVCGREVWEDKIDQAGLMRNIINGRDKNLNRKKPEHEFLESWMRRELWNGLPFLPAPRMPEQQCAPLPEAFPRIILLPKAPFVVGSDRGAVPAL